MKKSSGKSSQNPMSRRWTFTIYPENIPSADKIIAEGTTWESETGRECLLSFLRASLPGYRGFYASLEEGDSKEHQHLQGYAEFFSPVRFKRLQEEIGCGIHLEAAQGSRLENFDYIFHQGPHKDKGKLWWATTVGDFPRNSGDAKNMYDECVEMIVEGRTILSIARYYKGAILPMMGNLKRLQDEVSRENDVDLAWAEARRRRKERADEERLFNEIPF